MKYFNSRVKYQFINPDTQTLLMVEPEVSLNIFEWVKENRYLLEEYSIKCNGVLLRNFGIYSVSEFNKVVQIICPNLLDDVYRSTPRTRLGGKIYTATEYLDVFLTKKREEVDKFCKDYDIQFQWNNSGPELTTRQVCQATITHSITGEPVWFNQAHLFHISALEEIDHFSLIKELGENNIPRNTFYGDGSSIEIEVLEHIRKVYNEAKIKFKWHKDDIIILDNVLTAHVREPFKEERKGSVAMA